MDKMILDMLINNVYNEAKMNWVYPTSGYFPSRGSAKSNFDNYVLGKLRLSIHFTPEKGIWINVSK